MLNDGVNLMLIPSGGFGWVMGTREVAGPGLSECVLNLPAATAGDVDELLERAQRAGAEILTPAGQQPWGYAGAFCDPDGHVWMVTSEFLREAPPWLLRCRSPDVPSRSTSRSRPNPNSHRRVPGA